MMTIGNAGRKSGIKRLISTTVESAIADSTSGVSALSSAATGKRKSVEKDTNQHKKRKLDKKFDNSLVHSGTSVVKPLMECTPVVKRLMDFNIPQKTGV